MLLYVLACTSADKPQDDTAALADTSADTDTDTGRPDSDTGPSDTDSGDTDAGDTADTDTGGTDTDTGEGDTDTGPHVPTDRSVADADVVLIGGMDWGGAGASVVSVGDLDGDGLPELVVGAREEASAATAAGSAYVVAAADLVGRSHALLDVGYQLAGNGYASGAGFDVAGGADVDGDGGPDLVVVAARNGYGPGVNGVHVFWAPPVGAGGRGSVDDADHLFLCEDSRWSAAAVLGGDLDGDGRTDLVVGCPGEKTVYAVNAATPGQSGPDDALVALGGITSSFYAGLTVESLGDVDGDGLDDLGVGGRHLGEDAQPGQAWIVLDPGSGARVLPDVAHTLWGEVGDGAGIALAGVGDVDGDGLADVAIGVRNSNLGGEKAGAAAVLAGGAWTAGASDALADRATLWAYGTVLRGGAGNELAPAGDVDGDGTTDLLIGAEWADGYAGEAWVLHGPFPTGSVPLEGTADRLRGEAAGDYAGNSLAGLGDLDGDGLDDIAVGAEQADTTTIGGGKVYLFFGE